MSELRAKLERAGWFGFGEDLVGERLRFEIKVIGWHCVVRTGREGIARWSAPFGDLPEGEYTVAVRHLESDAHDTATLFVRSRTTPILIVDIDGTISAGTAWQILLLPPERIPPVSDAVTVLRSLNDYLVVYLTARKDNLYHRTKQWLEGQGFPRGPLFCRPEQEESQFRFKLRVLRRLAIQFQRIVAGVGDRPHDARAYLACGIPALVIGRPAPDFPPETEFLASWRQVPGLLQHLRSRNGADKRTNAP